MARMQRVVALHERLVEQLGQLLGRERVAAAPAAAHPLALAALVALALALEVVEQLGQVVTLVADGVVAAPQREVDLEHGLEGPPVGVVLHERRGQRVLERLAVLERDVA